MGVGRLNGNGLREFLCAWFCIIVVEGFEAAASADGVNVALSENGAQPGLERAATVEITEKRALTAISVGKSIELGKKRVGEFAGFRGSGAAAEHGGSRGAKVRAIGADEVFPCG